MRSVQIKRRFDAPPEMLWGILTDQNQLAQLAPDIRKTIPINPEPPYFKYQVQHANGASWKETCIHWEPQKTYTVKIEAQHYPLDIAEMYKQIIVEQKRKLVAVILRYEYLPKYGPFGCLVDKLQIRPILQMFTHQFMNNLENEIYNRAIRSKTTAKTIVQQKQKNIPHTLPPHASVAAAIKLIIKYHISCLAIVCDRKKILGILSEKDIIRHLSKYTDTIMDTPVSELMTHNVITCQVEDNIDQLMGIMDKKRIRHLPLVNHQGILIDIISIGDIVKSRIKELENESMIMQQYLENRRWTEISLEIGRSGAVDVSGN